MRVGFVLFALAFVAGWLFASVHSVSIDQFAEQGPPFPANASGNYDPNVAPPEQTIIFDGLINGVPSTAPVYNIRTGIPEDLTIGGVRELNLTIISFDIEVASNQSVVAGLPCYSTFLAGPDGGPYTEEPNLDCSVAAGALPGLFYSVSATYSCNLIVIWDGDNSGNPGAINYRGLGGVDLTDGGIDNGINIILEGDDLEADLILRVYTNETAHSSTTFDPRSIIDENKRNFIKGFADFSVDPDALTPADFTNVGAITMSVVTTATVDLGIRTVETVSLLTHTKSYSLATDVNGDGIAEPNDVILYSFQVDPVANGFLTALSNVTFFDNPSALNSFISLIPGTVSVEPADQGDVLLGNGASDTVVLINFPSITTGDNITVTFEATVEDLPCCLDECTYVPAVPTPGIRTGCQVPAQGVGLPDNEDCHCGLDQSFVCTGLDAAQQAQILAQEGIAGFSCLPSSDLTAATDPVPTSTPIFAAPDPQISKSTTTTIAHAGDTIIYSVRVRNPGTRQSPTLTIQETIPTDTSFLAGSSSPLWSCSGSTCTIPSIDQLPGGFDETFTFALQVNNPLPCGSAEVQNIASLIIDPDQDCACPDSNLNNNLASVTIPISGAPDLSLNKTASVSSATPGSVIIFHLQYSNLGSSSAESPTITETVPASTIFSAASSSSGWSCPDGSPAGTVCTLAVADVAGAPTEGSPPVFSRDFAVTVLSGALAADCFPLSIVNQASINNLCSDSNPDNNNASITVPVTGTPDLALTKTDNGASVLPGAVVIYTLVASNVGNRGIDSVTISDAIPNGLSFNAAGSSFGWSCTSTTCTFNIGTLAAGGASQTTLAFTVSAGITCTIQSVTNTATISGICSIAPETVLSNNQASDGTPVVGLPDIALTKTPATQTVGLDSVLVYSIQVANVGTRIAQNVQVTEAVPARSVFNAAQSSSLWNCPNGAASGTSCVAVIPSVAFGTSQTLAFAINRTAPANCDEVITNNACGSILSCPGFADPNPNNDCSTASVTPLGQPDLSVIRVDSGTSYLPGQTVVAQIRYANDGTAHASGLVFLIVTIPSTATFSAGSSSPGWDCVDDTCTLSLNTPILVGTTYPVVQFAFTVDTNLPCNADVNYNVSITTTCPGGDLNPADNSYSVSVPISSTPQLTVVKVPGVDGARPGDTVTYTIAYGNTGNGLSQGVVLTEFFPVNTAPVGDNIWDCGVSNCTLSLPDLAAGNTSGEVQFSVQVQSDIPRGSNSVINTVTITDSCGNSDSDTVTIPVIGNPDLQVLKEDQYQCNDCKANPGDTVYYTITYSNVGDLDSTGVVLTETVPPFSTFNAAQSTPGWSCPDQSPAGTTCTYSNPTANGLLSPGQGRTIVFAVNLNQWIRCGVDFVGNTVTIADDGTHGPETSYTNNVANVDTPVCGLPDLAITKNDGLNDVDPSDRVGPDGVIKYTLAYTNLGVRDAYDAVINDTVPQYTTFDLADSVGNWSCEDGAPAGTVCYAPIPTVYPYQQGSVIFAVRVVDSIPADVKGTYNTASIGNACGDLNLLNNNATDFTWFGGLSDMEITKDAHCRTIIWSLEYENIGDQGAVGVLITDTVPYGTVFNSEKSDPDWDCAGDGAGNLCYLEVGDVASGAGGYVIFATDPLNDTSLVNFTNTADITDVRTVPDPTPQNNEDTATVSFQGCPDQCDSCCPPVDECCPEQTEVLFNFGGILDGISSCDST